MDIPADCDTLVIDENSFARRKSSVSFNTDLDHKKIGETSWDDDEKTKEDEKSFEREYYFSSEARASIFSIISEMLLPLLSSKCKCFFLNSLPLSSFSWESLLAP